MLVYRSWSNTDASFITKPCSNLFKCYKWVLLNIFYHHVNILLSNFYKSSTTAFFSWLIRSSYPPVCCVNRNSIGLCYCFPVLIVLSCIYDSHFCNILCTYCDVLSPLGTNLHSSLFFLLGRQHLPLHLHLDCSCGHPNRKTKMIHSLLSFTFVSHPCLAQLNQNDTFLKYITQYL